MNDQQFCCKWIGAYTYGNEYNEPVKGKTVPFEMELTIVNGSIKGECTDAESMPEVGCQKQEIPPSRFF